MRAFMEEIGTLDGGELRIEGMNKMLKYPEYANLESFKGLLGMLEKKDYIQKPKANGYRSLHLIVSIPIFLSGGKREMRVEIQLRTIAMDIWASLEHQMNYKSEAHIPTDLTDALHECAELAADLDEKMNVIHKSIEQLS
jgi:putative GTP pyrophosphokinase